MARPLALGDANLLEPGELALNLVWTGEGKAKISKGELLGHIFTSLRSDLCGGGDKHRIKWIFKQAKNVRGLIHRDNLYP